MKTQYFFSTLKDLNALKSKYSKPDLRKLKEQTKILYLSHFKFQVGPSRPCLFSLNYPNERLSYSRTTCRAYLRA